MNDSVYYYVWQTVVGDFNAFKEAKQNLGPNIMPTADLIQL